MKTIFAIFSILISSYLFSASFDCDDARSKIEKQICSSKTLDKLDNLIGWQYIYWTEDPKNFYLKYRMQKEQRLWIKQRNKQCSSFLDDLLEKCLIKSYEKRLKELQLLEKKTSKSFSVNDNKECSNIKIIDKILVNVQGDTCSKYSYLDKNKSKNLLLYKQQIPTLFLDRKILNMPSQSKNCDDYPFNSNYKENIVYINPVVLSLMYERWSYTGGAHGDGGHYYINYNRQTGEAITWEMLFKNNSKFTNYVKNRVKNELLQEGFVYERYLDATLESFKKSGFFSIRSDGLYIEYGLYELAPYSSGLPSLLISKKVLKKYMTKALYRKYFINDGTVYLSVSCPELSF